MDQWGLLCTSAPVEVTIAGLFPGTKASVAREFIPGPADLWLTRNGEKVALLTDEEYAEAKRASENGDLQAWAAAKDSLRGGEGASVPSAAAGDDHTSSPLSESTDLVILSTGEVVDRTTPCGP